MGRSVVRHDAYVGQDAVVGQPQSIGDDLRDRGRPQAVPGAVLTAFAGAQLTPHASRRPAREDGRHPHLRLLQPQGLGHDHQRVRARGVGAAAPEPGDIRWGLDGRSLGRFRGSVNGRVIS